MFPKSRRWKSEAYLDYVRSQDCCACGRSAPSHPHHWGPDKGMGRKCSDMYTVPLCWQCHEEWHNHRKIGLRDSGESMDMQVLVQRNLMAEYLTRVMLGDDEQDDSTPSVTKPPPSSGKLPSLPWTDPPPSPGSYHIKDKEE